MTLTHWDGLDHGLPATDDLRRVTCDDCRASTGYLAAVVVAAWGASAANLGARMAGLAAAVQEAAARFRERTAGWQRVLAVPCTAQAKGEALTYGCALMTHHTPWHHDRALSAWWALDVDGQVISEYQEGAPDGSDRQAGQAGAVGGGRHRLGDPGGGYSADDR